MHFLLFYEFVPDYLERRVEYRAKHLQLARETEAKGELILAGAYANPVDGAALLFQCATREIPERFVAADPYVQSGLVTRWSIREWTTVVGRDASTPVR
jgi:uncharacterized protein YciI